MRRLLLNLGCGLAALLAAPSLAASPEALRAAALEAVNADRAVHGLAPLTPDAALNEAAQRHADDMLTRGYFGHVSPEGCDAMDRYLAAGGEKWRKVGENVGQCAECGAPGPESIRLFQQGWMESPEHRRNVLDPGYRRFGFGVAAADGRQFAVQAFAGPGVRRGEPLAPEDLARRALAAVNAARAAAGVRALAQDPALDAAARRFLEGRAPESGLDGAADALIGALGPRWGALVVLSGECGGCGTQPTDDDARRFMQDWLERPGYRETLLDGDFDRFGFAAWADGEGRKAALALLGRS